MIASGIQPIQNLRVLKRIADLKGDKIEWGHHWIDHGFTALEKYLAKTAGKCCVGDNITMADCCLVPQVYNAARFNVDMSKFPTIQKVYSHLQKLPAVEAAAPEKMLDAKP